MPSLRFLAPLCALLFLLSCSGPSHQHSFYYWKFGVDNRDSFFQKTKKELNIQHFYLHYFDVDWSEHLAMPVPMGTIYPGYFYSSYSELIDSCSYTPVIFITSRTFERISDAWCDSLAHKITVRIRRFDSSILSANASDYIHHHYSYDVYMKRTSYDSLEKIYIDQQKDRAPEIQIDCDWTLGGKDKYFRFLEKLKKLNPHKTISVTVRLYPYKYYKKMGVPPADRGMLMCYNMGTIGNEATANSIFSLSEMNKYFESSGKYPLPLDVALPIFGWQAWFRDGHYKGILHSGHELAYDSTAFSRVNVNTIRLLQDTVVEDTYYREGDEFRTEKPDTSELVSAANIIAAKVPGYGRITFFDFNAPSIRQYETAIKKIYSAH